MIGELEHNASGEITNAISSYQPKSSVRELSSKITQDYRVASDIQHRSFREFNDLSVLNIASRDQKAFNSFVEQPSDDPYENWKWNGIRPVTRNKLISIAAHATAKLIYPKSFAQNKNNDQDKLASEIMDDMVEYHIRNSDYELSFLFGVISMLVNPVAYMSPEFTEVMQDIKLKDEKGHISKKEVVDGVLSGFNVNIIPFDEILISNPYEYYHQKQRFIIRKRFIDFDEAKANYGKHANWKFINPGVRTYYEDSKSTFYDIYDDELDTLVEEVTYSNRREDIEIVFLNGIYMGDENVTGNRMSHRDQENRPLYKEAKSGFEPIDEKRFYYYKSAATKFSHDANLVNNLWQLRMDNTLLAGQPPVFTSGQVRYDSSVRMPRAVTAVGKDAKVTTIGVEGNVNVIDKAIEMVENSISESSQDALRAGVISQGEKPTAREVILAEKNAQIAQGVFKKMIGNWVKDFGYLMVDEIIHHETIADVIAIADDDTGLKYKTFLLDKEIEGEVLDKKIVFDEKLLGESPNPLEKSFELLEEEGGVSSKKRIFRANPEKFRDLRFKLIISPDVLNPLSEELERALKLDSYDKMITNPLLDQEAVTKDFLVAPLAKGNADKYMRKQQQLGIQPMVQRPPQQGGQAVANSISQGLRR